MKGTSQKLTLHVKLDMENKGCLLFDISRTVKPYIELPIYLCVDFVGNSIIVGSEHPTKSSMQLPILCQINLKNSHDKDNVVEIDSNFNKILWLPSRCSPGKEDVIPNQIPMCYSASFCSCHMMSVMGWKVLLTCSAQVIVYILTCPVQHHKVHLFQELHSFR